MSLHSGAEHAIFHYEVVKKAVVLPMEEKAAEAEIWALLPETADKGLITSS
jgi:programmed cell death protein 4